MYKAAVFSIFMMMPSMAQDQCRVVTFQEPRREYLCLTENYTTISQVPHHLCTHVCMQKNCSFINYNHEKSYCQLGLKDCKKIILNPEFTVTVTSFPPLCLPVIMSPCIQWVPIAEVMDGKDIPCDLKSSTFRVGRLVLRTDIVVGKFRSQHTNAWCWALQRTFDPTPGIPQEHDSTTRRHSSVYPRQATHVLFTKNGPVESECKLNNVNPHIIRNQIQNQIEVTLSEHRCCKLCHYHTNTEF